MAWVDLHAELAELFGDLEPDPWCPVALSDQRARRLARKREAEMLRRALKLGQIRAEQAAYRAANRALLAAKELARYYALSPEERRRRNAANYARERARNAADPERARRMRAAKWKRYAEKRRARERGEA